MPSRAPGGSLDPQAGRGEPDADGRDGFSREQGSPGIHKERPDQIAIQPNHGYSKQKHYPGSLSGGGSAAVHPVRHSRSRGGAPGGPGGAFIGGKRFNRVRTEDTDKESGGREICAYKK